MPDRDWIIIIVLGFLWGTSFFFNEVLLREMGPLGVSFARVTMAAIFCWVWLFATGCNPRVDLQLMPKFAFMGVMMFAIPFAVYPIGQQYVASGVAGIVNALTRTSQDVESYDRATDLERFGGQLAASTGREWSEIAKAA